MDVREKEFYKAKSLLGFDEVDLDTPVYRVYAIHWLIELFRMRQNTLVKPASWDDPFENLIFKQTATLKNGQLLDFSEMHEHFYGQCWTLNSDETDAQWRIYSPDKRGVRVKTTLRKLFDSFYNLDYKWAMISFYLGKVMYETENELRAHFEDPTVLQDTLLGGSNNPVKTLLYKRKAFEHEKEIRLIYQGNKEFDDLSRRVYKYDIDPPSLLDELVFDPRFNEEEYTVYEKHFRSEGFEKLISKSTLYEPPQWNLRVNLG